MPREQIHFVTGRLAEHSLRQVLARLAPQVGFEYSVQVLNITVAALMTTPWVAKRIDAPAGTTRVILPGYCQGELDVVATAAGTNVELGPRDLRCLPDYFGRAPADEGYGAYDIEIIAEINHGPRLALADILAEAERLRADGADVIDVGCDPGDAWSGVAEVVRALRDAGHRVSIDSLNPREIEPAVRAGAELVLSVNSSNRDAAADWGCEVVAIPDVPATLAGLDETIEALAAANVRLRIDPVLEPIGFGFAASLGRYLEIRRRYPDAEMMMGIGNLTELTDVDSAGVNAVLLGFCQEQGIRSVLTTQVINWARSSTRECDLARRLVHHAVEHRVLPKRLEPRLVMLRDPELLADEDLERLAHDIKDHNYRVFAQSGELHLVSSASHLASSDPFELFDKLLATKPRNIDAGHAFYLGYELSKALTAITLGKQYQQDEALRWGFLTRAEEFHRLARTKVQAEDSPASESSAAATKPTMPKSPDRILEGIVTTLNADGSPNISPMGPLLDEAFSTLLLRPYQTSTTYQNLQRTGEGVLHVTDDVELIAHAAVGALDPPPTLQAASVVAPPVLADACRWYEFRVTSINADKPRTEIVAKVVATGRGRDFFGFNRAKHAVLEAAILATRVNILPPTEILAELERLAIPVQKTAGEAERRAFAFLDNYIRASLPLPLRGTPQGSGPG